MGIESDINDHERRLEKLEAEVESMKEIIYLLVANRPMKAYGEVGTLVEIDWYNIRFKEGFSSQSHYLEGFVE